MGSYDQMSNNVDAAIRATAARAGMTPAEWKAIASIESSLNPQSNYNEGTQYKGLYQIGARGQGSEWSLHGSGNIYDPMDNATAAANIANGNNAWFRSTFGRNPSAIETYMMHQQGRGFYANGTMTNIAGNLPPEDRTPENMTHNGFQAYWANKLASRANKFRDPNDPNEITYGGEDVGASRGGGAPSGATARAGGAAPGGGGTSTEPSADDTEGTDDYAAQMSAIADQIAKRNEANAPPPLQPMQPMMTPAMLRTKQLVQAMMNLQSGGGSATS
jgi:hypothetical protein